MARATSTLSMVETVTQDPFAEIEALKQALHARDQHIAILEEELRLVLHKRFAASSEKAPPDQLYLFNEAEVLSADAIAEDAATTVPEQLDIVPAKIQVLQDVRFKCACRSCEGVEDDGLAVVIAPIPPHTAAAMAAFRQPAPM